MDIISAPPTTHMLSISDVYPGDRRATDEGPGDVHEDDDAHDEERYSHQDDDIYRLDREGCYTVNGQGKHLFQGVFRLTGKSVSKT